MGKRLVNLSESKLIFLGGGGGGKWGDGVGV